MIGENIKEMILKTSIYCLLLLKGKIDEFFCAIMKTVVDPSPLKSKIEKYVVNVNHLDAMQRANSTKISFKVHSERLATVAYQIADILNSKSVEARHRQSLKADLVTLNTKKNAFKKELKQPGIQREHLHNLILEIDENLINKQNDISHLREEHVAIAQTPMLTTVDIKTLEILQKVLWTQRDKLACLVWV